MLGCLPWQGLEEDNANAKIAGLTSEQLGKYHYTRGLAWCR